LAIFARDWPAADETVRHLLSASTGDWELETVRRNLESLAASSSTEDQEPIARLGERLGFGSMTE
jgi:hypothetical protein